MGSKKVSKFSPIQGQSRDLLWEIMGNNSAFMVKRKFTPCMTTEPGNITGVNSKRFSGLCNEEAIDMNIVTSGKKKSIVMRKKCHKRAAHGRKPDKLWHSIPEEDRQGSQANRGGARQ